MGKFYENSIVPKEMRRDYDVYDRIKKLGIPMGSFDEDVKSLAGADIAGAPRWPVMPVCLPLDR